MPQKVAAKKLSPVVRWERVSQIDRSARRRTSWRTRILDMAQVAVGIQIVQRAVLAEVLLEIRALHGVPEQAAVRSCKTGCRVRRTSSRRQLPPPSQKQLELLGDRMIPPDALLELDAADVAGRRAAVEAVQPAVGTPSQVIGQRLGVFHAEAGQQHFGIAVGHVVAIGGPDRTADTEPATRYTPPWPNSRPVARVEPVDEVLGSSAWPSPSVSSRIVMRSAPVGPRGGRFGNAIVNGPRPAIDLNALQPGRVRILQVLNRPESPAVVDTSRRIGCRTSGSLAKSWTLSPSATVIFDAAMSGEYPCAQTLVAAHKTSR